MPQWEKETALAELKGLIDWIQRLKKEKRFSAEHIRWRARTQTFLFEVFGPKSLYHPSFAAIDWSFSGMVEADQEVINAAHQRAYLDDLEVARGLLLAAQDQLQRQELAEVYRGKGAGPEASVILKVLNLAELKLRKAVREVPTKEKAVQDSFETLLVGADIAYSREVGGIEYSSKTYQPDFVIPSADLAVELKLCKDGAEKALIAQINDDILAYSTRYGNLLFVVYDLGQIRDAERFCSSFQSDRVLVRVVKH
jgi:hypothetical protein